jgi:hypothetical protein
VGHLLTGRASAGRAGRRTAPGRGGSSSPAPPPPASPAGSPRRVAPRSAWLGAAALVGATAVGACGADIPSGRYACGGDEDCPPGFSCAGGLCYAPGVRPDAAAPDLGVPDLGERDAGDPDLGGRDAGDPDLGGRDAGAPDADCAVETVSLRAAADTTLVRSECNGANHQGASRLTHSGIGRPLYRFALPMNVESAFIAGRVRAMELVLTRFTDASLTGPCSGSCPATAGALVARPVRNDWDEGSDGSTSFVPYGGADWCRRRAGSSGAPWGEPGASQMSADVLATAGRAMVDATQPTVAIPLDPSLWGGLMFLGSTLSVQVFEGGATFLAISREEDRTRAAELRVSLCRP